MADPAAAFALFVSCVEGAPVARWGTPTLIGAQRRGLEPTVVDYDPASIVAIPHGEYARFRREYDRCLKNGSLVRRKVEDWRAQNRPPVTAAKDPE